MRVTIEMDWQQAKQHLYDSASGYARDGEHVAYLNFSERVSQHDPACDGSGHVTGTICHNRVERIRDYSFRVLEIKP